MKKSSRGSRVIVFVVLLVAGAVGLAWLASSPFFQPGAQSSSRPALSGSAFSSYPTYPPLPTRTATPRPKPSATPDSEPESFNFSQPRDPFGNGDYSKDALKQVLSNEQVFPTPGLLIPGGPDSRYNPIAPSTISFEIFQKVLAQGKSPALPEARAMYETCLRERCDPALALAFFDTESSLGTQGVAVQTRSLGNIRCVTDPPCVRTEGNGAFQAYYTWTQGLEAWVRLLRDTYLAKWRLATVEQIIPRYAPGDQSIGYIKAVKRKVDNLRLFGRLH